MSTAATYEKDVTMLPETASAYQVAAKMQECAVGSVVIIDEEGRPHGIITDRDLAVRVIAHDQDAGRLTASAVMSAPVFTAAASDPLARVIEVMCRHGVRRVPILRDSRVTGIVALDDVLAELRCELDDLCGSTRRQMFEARLAASLPRLREEIEARLSELGDRLKQVGSRASEKLGREFEELRDRVRRTLQ
jgi:signal-transduction protein with cAMP-binding, CBS, and nucleotidyltransferase domain